MTGNQTRRVLVTVVAAGVLVVGGAVAASGQMGALRDWTATGSPADGPVTGDATDDATDAVTEDETAEDETTEDETTEDEATEDEATEDEATEDEADATTEDEGSDGEDPDGTGPKAPCALTSPPNRAAEGTDADHPGWSTGKHLGWCVAAAHHDTTGRPAKPGNARGDKHARPAVKVPKKPHPGKGHAKHH